MLFVFHPAISAILAAKPIFQGVDVSFKGPRNLGLDAGEVFGVNPVPPEIRILKVIKRVVSEHALDAVADECGPERSSRFDAVDHGRRRTQHLHETLLHGSLHLRYASAQSISRPRRTQIMAPGERACLGHGPTHAWLRSAVER